MELFPFWYLVLSYRSSSKCEWTEQQSHLWCVKLEKHILLFPTLKGLGTGWPIHQNISKTAFWWNFKVKGAVWLSKWCTETKKTQFNWCFNALEFSPQKSGRKHETMQSICKLMAYINPIKSWFLRFYVFCLVYMCGTSLTVGQSLHKDTIELDTDAETTAEWVHSEINSQFETYLLFFFLSTFLDTMMWKECMWISNMPFCEQMQSFQILLIISFSVARTQIHFCQRIYAHVYSCGIRYYVCMWSKNAQSIRKAVRQARQLKIFNLGPCK